MTSGIHTVDANTYHADPATTPSLSSTIANILCTQSPIHAWAAHPRLNPDYKQAEADHFDIGTCAHALLLEGVEKVEVVEAKDWRTNAAKEQRDTARAEGRVALLAAQWDDVQAMVTAARIQLDGIAATPKLLAEDGQPEQTLLWEEDGVYCRARPDWLHDNHKAIDDYKTTGRTANPTAWTRTLFNVGYDIQAAFYLRGLHALTGIDAEWRWIVQETQPPYALSVVALTPAALELANDKVEYAIRRWRDCLESGIWPGYPTDICYAEVPSWNEYAWMEKEEREATV